LSNRFVLGAVGDISLFKGVAEGTSRHGVDWAFDAMREDLTDVDFLFGNLETVFVPASYDRSRVRPGELVSPISGPECASALANAGFDFLNLASNHILDAGITGLQYTEKVLNEVGIATAGVGRDQATARLPRICERNGLRIGVLCYCEDNNYSLGVRGPAHAFYRVDDVIEDVTALRSSVDLLIVSVHADLEFMSTPSMPRRSEFRRIASHGADLILGHHPHVPQGCERIGKTLIAYSLGNFIFPARSSQYMLKAGPETARSFLLRVEMSENGVGDCERIPFEIGPRGEERPLPLAGESHENAIRYFEELDAAVADDETVLENWRNAVLSKCRAELRGFLRSNRKSLPAWKRALSRLLGLHPPDIDMDRVLDEMVGRYWLTAENRAWVNEVLRMGEERWQKHTARGSDACHRPHRMFEDEG
jgi:poly-gamma-glutamate synthesis protein (capsule biosynthesis protein)